MCTMEVLVFQDIDVLTNCTKLEANATFSFPLLSSDGPALNTHWIRIWIWM